MNCKSQLKRIAIQKGEAMPGEDNVREKFQAWLKEDTTIELDDELTDFAWYVWKAATAESAARIADKLEQEPVCYMQENQPYVYVSETKNEGSGYTIPLYTSPPNAKDFATLEKAIRVAAVMEAIKAIKPNKDGYTSPKLRPMMESIHVISEMNCEIIQTLITEDDKDALRDLMMKAVTTAIMEYGSGDWSQPDADAIVDRVLESK